MEIKNGKKVRNRKSAYIPTCVKGVRGEEQFWIECENYAKRVGMSRNELFLVAVSDYMKRNK